MYKCDKNTSGVLVAKTDTPGMEVRDSFPVKSFTIKFKIYNFLWPKKQVFESRYKNPPVYMCECP